MVSVKKKVTGLHHIMEVINWSQWWRLWLRQHTRPQPRATMCYDVANCMDDFPNFVPCSSLSMSRKSADTYSSTWVLSGGWREGWVVLVCTFERKEGLDGKPDFILGLLEWSSQDCAACGSWMSWNSFVAAKCVSQHQSCTWQQQISKETFFLMPWRSTWTLHIGGWPISTHMPKLRLFLWSQ